jgi:hypothetical protein
LIDFGSQQALFIGATAAVGVLHTVVPDHWAPIALMARQRRWSKSETLRAALQAGTGHVLSTLFIGALVWIAGVAVAKRFGHMVDTITSVALIVFGAWIALFAWRELHGHAHGHDHHHHETKSRTALLIILGASPMVEGIPLFFAAGKYGFGFLAFMSAVLAVSTIVTYAFLCVFSAAALQRMRFGAFERYGEVLSGVFMAIVGLAFWIWSTA